MSERIKELLVQCTQESIDGSFANRYVDQEKFAELVVKECLSICQKVHDEFESDGQKFNIDWMQRQIAINICKSEIKQHFGIENE